MRSDDGRSRTDGHATPVARFPQDRASQSHPERSAATGSPSRGERLLTVLHTNDEHSALLPHAPPLTDDQEFKGSRIGGFARLATAVAAVRATKEAEGEPVLLLSAGDFLGGSPFSWLALRGHSPELSLMEALGYDAVTLGNHEFDYGSSVLARYFTCAGYPEAHERTLLLATNTAPRDGHPLAAEGMLRRQGLLRLQGGLQVGVIGLLGEEAVGLTHSSNDVVFRDACRTASDAAARLRAQGADIVIVLSHSGLEGDKELAREVPELDLIVGGHCHSVLHEPVEEGRTLIVQAGSRARYLGVLELAYDPNTGSLRTRNTERNRPFLVPIDGQLEPCAEIASLVSGYTTELSGFMGEVTRGTFGDMMATVARSPFSLPNVPPCEESQAANFITDAMRSRAEERTKCKVHVAVQANGNIRGPFVPGWSEHAHGHLTLYDLVEVIGLGCGADGRPGYPMVSAYLTGEELYRLVRAGLLLGCHKGNSHFLQFSGLRYRYSRSTLRVLRVDIWIGTGLQPTGDAAGYTSIDRGDRALYHVVTDAYVYSLMPLLAASLPDLVITPKDMRGEPIPPSRMGDRFVRHEDRSELKVWEAVATHAAGQPPGDDGIPEFPAYYARLSERMIAEP